MHVTELTLSEMSERIRDAKMLHYHIVKSFDMNPLGLTTYPGPSVRTSRELRVSLLICVHQTFCMSCSDVEVHWYVGDYTYQERGICCENPL